MIAARKTGALVAGVGGAADVGATSRAPLSPPRRPPRPASVDLAYGDSDSERAKRRRRGRRGGRRMRDDARPGDVYGWSWPARPVGDDPYQWRGPVQAQLAPAPTATPVAAACEPASERMFEVADDVQPPVIDDAASVDVWVELPPAEDAPRKGRARRARGKPAAAEAPPAESAVVQPIEAAPTVVAPAEPKAVESDTVEPVAMEAAAAEALDPAPVVETVVAEPVEAAVEPALISEPAPRPVDANEILAPPATPKRGWWRRGA